MNRVLIEAESFKNQGGWVVDTLSMENIHSAYLMAHGIGEPVDDAITDFEVLKRGEYYVWALTRDWTATWDIKDSAGKFSIRIDDRKCENVLGTNGKDWAWQFAGKVMLNVGKHTLALHDLTGFNGRCDAIFLTDSAEIPSSERSAIDKMREELNWKEIKESVVVYDLVVVGGRIAGICTALSAYRKGCRVALINDRAILGGCNSSEIRVCMGGQIKHPPYENIGNVVQEIAPIMGHPTIYKEEYFEDMRKLFAFQIPCGEGVCDVLLNESVFELEQEDNIISSVICTNTLSGEKTRIKGKLFSDCSGDGVLGRLCGAELMYGNEAKSEFNEDLAPSEHKNLVMGHSIRWYSEEQDAECTFPDLDWNLPFDEASYLNCFSGDWEQETGFTRDMIKEAEYIRDYGLRAIFANWSYQKNHCENKERFAKSKIKWISPLGGKRESYRVKGDYVLTQKDLDEQTDYVDGTAKITWGIDIHYPEPINEEKFGEAFRSFAYHRNTPFACPVPYRCLYSKDIDNLFIGGRLVSASHIAFSAIRVMRTLGMLGEVVGIASSICKRHNCFPRNVYQQYLEELKNQLEIGVTVPSAFACGGIGIGESYHFKDIGWWNLHDGTCADNTHKSRTPKDDEVEKFKYCVNKLGIKHKYEIPDQWK
jgi:hypothetical protein